MIYEDGADLTKPAPHIKREDQMPQGAGKCPGCGLFDPNTTWVNCPGCGEKMLPIAKNIATQWSITGKDEEERDSILTDYGLADVGAGDVVVMRCTEREDGEGGTSSRFHFKFEKLEQPSAVEGPREGELGIPCTAAQASACRFYPGVAEVPETKCVCQGTQGPGMGLKVSLQGLHFFCWECGRKLT